MLIRYLDPQEFEARCKRGFSRNLPVGFRVYLIL